MNPRLYDKNIEGKCFKFCFPDISISGSLFPIFFPLRTPVCVQPGIPLIVHLWRCCGSTKVWYEWCVSSPVSTPVQNPNGRSYWVGL
ncbi:unnamed protein product [Coffea canephora]|uniref:PRMT5 oligomerisation domain-containing protein n=1 Tax=Coffea canephora TaxID=49390 RepID=A0A068V979_COFCA|nr:unnamed protein product [Coffea canephora]